MTLESILERAERLALDMNFDAVRAWKAEEAGRKAIGCLPVYVPEELIWAAGMLPVPVFGGGDRIEVVRGDAYFQSYICHLPRSVIELGVSGRLDCLDGCLFPATCDVIRNLSGMWQILFPETYVRYLDVPQAGAQEVGAEFFRRELAELREDLERLRGEPISDAAIWKSIETYDALRRAIHELYELRAEAPWVAPLSEAYLVLRAGTVLPPDEHRRLIRQYLKAALASDRQPFDAARVLLVGSFCEQPPVGLLRTLERAGCDVLSDDLLLGMRWYDEDLYAVNGEEPLTLLARSFMTGSPDTASVYSGSRKKGADLVRAVEETGADGVVFCAPSFCDPALLDRPMLAEVLEEADIPFTQVKYSENTAQFQGLREQAGTFSDSLKLWSHV